MSFVAAATSGRCAGLYDRAGPRVFVIRTLLPGGAVRSVCVAELPCSPGETERVGAGAGAPRRNFFWVAYDRPDGSVSLRGGLTLSDMKMPP